MTVHRKIRRFFAAAFTVLLLAVQPAFADIKTRLNAVETSPKYIILPGNTNGMMTFQACSSVCEDVPHQRVQLTPNTRFMVNGRVVKFADFRAHFANLKRKELSFALVSYETATNAVTQIDIAG